jgi:molecular chaperone DnaJ
MSSKRDYYEVLGVERSANKKQIDAAYRRVAIKFHPDSNQGDESATDKFKEAAAAYEVLGDEDKRHRYDQFGHAGLEGGGGPQVGDLGDIFAMFGDLFGGGGGGGGRGRQRRGGDVRCQATLDLEEAARGAEKTVEYKRNQRCNSCEGSGAATKDAKETCRRCGGRGQVVQQAGILRVQTTCPGCQGTGTIISVPCKSCRGSGFTAEKVKKTFHVPAGVDSGTRVRYTGEGEQSLDGGPPGDCYLFIEVRPHSLFEREGKHLLLNLPITYSQAALGATIEVPTLDGPETLDLPAGTQSGEVFRIRGRGIADPHGGGPGDMHVRTYIETPKILSPDQEELLRQLAELENAAVTPERQGFLEKLRNYFTTGETS